MTHLRINRKQGITLKTVLYFVALLPYMGFAGLRNFLGDSVYETWMIVGFGLLFVCMLSLIHSIRVNSFSVLFLSVQALIFLSTVLQHGFSFGVAVAMGTGVLLILLVTIDMREIIQAVSAIAVLALIINILMMLIRGLGDNTIYFIGGKNAFSIFLIPASFIVLFNALLRQGRFSLSSIIYVLASVVVIVVGGSGTGIIVSAVMVCFLLVFFNRTKYDLRKLFLICIIVNALFLLLIQQIANSSFWINFTGMLDKNSNLTSRTLIWDTCYKMLRKNWFLGLGRGVVISYVNSYGLISRVYEAHNFLLEIVLEGGVICLALYAGVLAKAILRLRADSRMHRLILIALSVFMVNGITESVNNSILLMLLLGVANYLSVSGQPSGNQEGNGEV